MQYTLLADRFGGLNTALSPFKLPPGVASDLLDVDLTGGVIRPRWSDEKLYPGLPNDACKSHYDWNGTLISDANERYVFAEWSGRLIRGNYRPDSTKAVPQYRTNSGTYWDALGIVAPPAACAAADAGAGAGPNGTYTYYVTFYGLDDDESAPSAASATVTVVDNDINLTAIPIGYGTGTTVNGSTTVTFVTAVQASFRVGMRLSMTNVPNGTYITAVSATTVTISQAATGSATNEMRDAQVGGRKIYRSGGTVASTLLVATIANNTTTTYTDSFADTELGEPLTTDGTSVLPACGGIDLSPAGVLAAIKPLSTGYGIELWFTEPGRPWQTKPTNYIKLNDNAGRALWALDRFCIFTQGGVYGLLGSNASNYELIRADGTIPSLFYWPVQMGSEVWYIGDAGVCAYDGSSVRSVSEGFLSAATLELFVSSCVGAIRVGQRWMAVHYERVLEYNPAIPGSPWLLHTTPSHYDGELAQCIAYNQTHNVIVIGTDAQTRAFNWEDYGARHTYYSYTTGYLPADKHSALRTFRATLVAGGGSWTSTPYTGSPYNELNGTADSYSTSSPIGEYERRIAWQASEFRGRAVKVKVHASAITAAYALKTYIDEIGVFVGGQRKLAP